MKVFKETLQYFQRVASCRSLYLTNTVTTLKGKYCKPCEMYRHNYREYVMLNSVPVCGFNTVAVVCLML